ncbi:C1 family peptidase [Corynebacterium accolens]|uniref:Aminopeptidase n=1 Tax=Corynebacterium accolens TaxID=38284 RepID=A0ABT7FM85_9CORY|nr:C1 family peptidase [Corynebacterium accolens]MDK4246620.1 C1 family peptidase [Corynebacterium accolens]
MNEINPQEVHTTNATLTSEPAIKAARNAVAQEGIDKLSVDRDLVRELTTATSHKLDKWGAANQKASGRCWIFAGLNSLRGGIMDRTNIKDFELSQTYLYFYDKLEKANWFLTAVDELKEREITDRTLTKLMDDPIGDGGQWSMFVSLVEKYGVVPKYAMPETASSEASAMLNRNLETVLRRAAHQIRAGKSGAQEQALADVYRILTANLGLPPTEFQWQYRDKDDSFHREGTFTPQEFAREYLPKDLGEYVCVVNDPRNNYGELYTVDYLGNVAGEKVTYLNAPVEVLRDATRSAIEDGRPVWFGCDTSQQSDADSGVWAKRLHDYEGLYGVEMGIEKPDRLRLHESLMTHAMVFTGADIAEGGDVTRWRVENSWGTEKGDKGFWTMADDWFDEYVFEIAVHPSRLPEQYQEALKSAEITTLPAWDPMGALAN